MTIPTTLFAAACKGGGLIGLPTWYMYLEGTTAAGNCSPAITGINDIWLIVAAVIEILLNRRACVSRVLCNVRRR